MCLLEFFWGDECDYEVDDGGDCEGGGEDFEDDYSCFIFLVVREMRVNSVRVSVM